MIGFYPSRIGWVSNFCKCNRKDGHCVELVNETVSLEGETSDKTKDEIIVSDKDEQSNVNEIAVSEKVDPKKIDKVEPKKIDKVEPKKIDKVEPKKIDKVEPKKIDKVEPKKIDKSSKASKADKSSKANSKQECDNDDESVTRIDRIKRPKKVKKVKRVKRVRYDLTFDNISRHIGNENHK
uniref:Uncharacterized protein n=1 Tax=Pithovirus LCPAC406 TaxID=2506599 RepID=A0A481ZGG8_9VIRU|nr:MAG: hypothetical protein LCPAC406_02540 [Pithovirus LCPAC406]